MDSGHGGNIYEIERTKGIGRDELVDYSANINPLGPPFGAKETILEALTQMNRYPDIAYEDLRTAVAVHEGISKEAVFLGNGAADVLFLLLRALHPRHAAVISPAFSEYRQACESVGCVVKDILLSKESGFLPEDSLLERIPLETELVFLCTPANPTGAVCSREMVEQFAAELGKRGCFLCVDESFLEFRQDAPERTAIPICWCYPNLVVLKSLTKFYAMAGARFGYAVSCAPGLWQEYQRISPPWTVNVFAERLTLKALQDKEYQQKSREVTVRQAEELYNGLLKISGIKPYPPGANFILFACHRHWDLQEQLLLRRILIRRCDEFAGLGQNWYRVCVSLPEKNRLLLDTLQEICGAPTIFPRE